MNRPTSAQPGRSLYVDILHYASIVALVGLGFIFLMIFLVGGTAQLVQVPADYQYNEYPYALESLWDYVWGNVDPYRYGEVAHQSGFIASFTLAFFFALGCAAVSSKIRREGPRLWLLITAAVLAAAGVGALHSYASVVLALPLAAALYGLIVMLVQSGLISSPTARGGYPPQQQWYQDRPHAELHGYPPQAAHGTPAAAAATGIAGSQSSPADACPGCGQAVEGGSVFCGNCGAKVG